MTKKRTFGAILALGLATTAAGCDDYRSAVVATYPWTAPVLGGRPTPTPFKLATGNIKGLIHGKEGPTQPIGLAFVSTGSVSTTAGNPQPDLAIASADEQDDGKDRLTVMHDFGDGAGEVPAERRVRRKAGGPDWRDKYVYLRTGEFFLEEVPDGLATLVSSFGGVTSQQTVVEVYPGNTRADIKIPLYIPNPVRVEGGLTPRVVDFVKSEPDTGISVSVQIKENQSDSGAIRREITVTYKPDPPDIKVYLKAPPGSAGTVIKGINLVYSWDTISGVHGETRPVPIPLSPVVVAPAQDTAYGPSAEIVVPVGSALIQKIFDQVDENDNPDPPGLIVVTMEFIDEQGFVVQDKNFQNLQVSTILRRL